MASSIDLNRARKNLADALGDSMKLYLQNLNSFFKRKFSKEEFDFESRKLMRNDTVHLHNEFLLALIAKCQILSSSVSCKDQGNVGKTQKSSKVKKKPPGGRANLQQRFIQAQTLDYVPQITSKALEEGASPTPLGFVSREGLLPDITMVHGRMLVCAWETGLSDVQENAVKLLMIALERKGYKLREGRFTYAVGIGVKNPYAMSVHDTTDPSSESLLASILAALLSSNSTATMITSNFQHTPSLRPSVETGEDVAVEQCALGADIAQDDLDPISLYDLSDTLMLFKNTIVSHSVYAPTIERVIHMKWHPSNEDLAQESIHEQEVYLKHKLAKRKDFDE